MTYQTPKSLHMRLSRRSVLGGLGAAVTLARFSPAYATVPFPQRLVLINVKGGVDGLSLVVPYGDPYLNTQRAALVPPGVGKPGGMFDLGGFYGLNPAMPNLAALYQGGQMLAVHAVDPITTERSHFAGQNALQTGDSSTTASGWINRLVSLLETTPGGVESGLILGARLPVIVQGPARFGAWATAPFPPTPKNLVALIEQLNAPDPLLGVPMQSGFDDSTLFKGWLASNPTNSSSSFVNSMHSTGVFLNAAGGPAVAVIETDTMDTHTDQVSRLAPLLSDLDSGIAALASASGAAWTNTVVITVTEFGRTAYVNGNGGTDHGTAFAMLLAGGAVNGGQVIADWPGLATSKLVDSRDLAPTVDMRAVIKGVLRDHLGVSTSGLATVFPDAGGIAPMNGLIRS